MWCTAQDQSILFSGETTRGKSENRHLAIKTFLEFSVSNPRKKGAKLSLPQSLSSKHLEMHTPSLIQTLLGLASTLNCSSPRGVASVTERHSITILKETESLLFPLGKCNFHIFYYLITGPSPEACQVVAAILHLGNLEFTIDRSRDVDATVVHNVDTLALIAESLGVQPSALENALSYKIKLVKKELCTVFLDSDGASDNRNDLTKTLYSLLFTWLNEHINQCLCRDDFDTFISLFDLPSPQNMTGRSNLLDQFCINFANERLHHFIQQCLFESHIDEYQSEVTYSSEVFLEHNLNALNSDFVALLHGMAVGTGIADGGEGVGSINPFVQVPTITEEECTDEDVAVPQNTVVQGSNVQGGRDGTLAEQIERMRVALGLGETDVVLGQHKVFLSQAAFHAMEDYLHAADVEEQECNQMHEAEVKAGPAIGQGLSFHREYDEEYDEAKMVQSDGFDGRSRLTGDQDDSNLNYGTESYPPSNMFQHVDKEGLMAKDPLPRETMEGETTEIVKEMSAWRRWNNPNNVYTLIQGEVFDLMQVAATHQCIRSYIIVYFLSDRDTGTVSQVMLNSTNNTNSNAQYHNFHAFIKCHMHGIIWHHMYVVGGPISAALWQCATSIVTHTRDAMYQTLKNSATNPVETSMNTDLAPVPRAIRATFFWIVLFYVLTILTTRLCISWGDLTLLASIYMIMLPKFLKAVVVLTLSLIRFQCYSVSDHCLHYNTQASR
ncbi:P-loop containing nucleoside triphosphate hydrolase protein [Pisolithus microcarpus]|nr:P-loop containing nucleoside triphosphate hydrolase protein [Pisolithus microcarpus]